MAGRPKRPQSGQALVILALMATVLVGFAAIAIDQGQAMADRRDLQAGADAASLAGARQYALGGTVSSAHFVALQFLAASFGQSVPSGCTSSSCAATSWTMGAYTITFTDGTSLLDVTVVHQQTIDLAGVIGVRTQNVGTSSRARGVASSGSGGALTCAICVLATSGTGINQQGTGIGATGGDIIVDSTSAGAINVQGGYVIAFSGARVGIATGGTCTSCGGGAVSPTPVSVTAVADPLAATSLLSAGLSGTTPSAQSWSTNACGAGLVSGTEVPGCYTTLGGGNLALKPGTYVITSQFTVGDSDISAPGVTLYFACSSWPTPCTSGGQAGASLKFTGNGSLTISAPTTVTTATPYANMAMFWDRNNTGGIDQQGSGGLSATGTIYGASALLNQQGNGNFVLNSAVIVKNIINAGNGFLFTTFAAGQNAAPGSSSGGSSGITR